VSWNAEQRRPDPFPGVSEGRETGVLDLFVQMLRLPMTMFVYATEMAAWTVRGVQRLADEGVAQAFGRTVQPARRGFPEAEAPAAAPGNPVELPGGGPSAGAPEIVNPGAVSPAADTRREERRAMPDMNLADDLVKLVRFTIVSIKRDDERILTRDEKIFDDNMTDDAFASWVISEYGDSEGLSSDDRKYLRVSYEVLGRWARQDRKYEKRQLEVLEGIRQELAK
jgi:hypothetical protein